MGLGGSSVSQPQIIKKPIERPQYEVSKVNNRITRAPGGRPHKIYDYMFI